MSEKFNKEEQVEVEKAEEQLGVGVYKLKKPFKIEGELKKEIPYDFSEITGKTVRKIRTELGKRKYFVSVPEIDDVYNAALFAEASGLSLDSVEALPLTDYNAVVNLAKDFQGGEE